MKRPERRLADALLSGFAGAATMTLIHESARRLRPDAPRLDTLGRRAIASGLEAIGLERPEEDKLQDAALVGDLASNTLYFALVGLGDPSSSLARGAALGAVAGLGTVALPPWLGLGSRPAARTPQTAAMAFAWYVAGGLAAGAIHRRLARP